MALQNLSLRSSHRSRPSRSAEGLTVSNAAEDGSTGQPQQGRSHSHREKPLEEGDRRDKLQDSTASAEVKDRELDKLVSLKSEEVLGGLVPNYKDQSDEEQHGDGAAEEKGPGAGKDQVSIEEHSSKKRKKRSKQEKKESKSKHRDRDKDKDHRSRKDKRDRERGDQAIVERGESDLAVTARDTQGSRRRHSRSVSRTRTRSASPRSRSKRHRSRSRTRSRSPRGRGRSGRSRSRSPGRRRGKSPHDRSRSPKRRSRTRSPQGHPRSSTAATERSAKGSPHQLEEPSRPEGNGHLPTGGSMEVAPVTPANKTRVVNGVLAGVAGRTLTSRHRKSLFATAVNDISKAAAV